MQARIFELFDISLGNAEALRSSSVSEWHGPGRRGEECSSGKRAWATAHSQLVDDTDIPALRHTVLGLATVLL